MFSRAAEIRYGVDQLTVDGCKTPNELMLMSIIRPTYDRPAEEADTFYGGSYCAIESMGSE